MRNIHKKILISGLVVVAVGVLVGTGLLVYYFRENDTSQLTDIADKLQPDASWELVSETIMPPRNICLSGKCNYLTRVWERDRPPIKSDYVEMLDRTGWDYELEDGCSVDEIKGDGVPRCDIEIIVDGHRVSVSISSNLYDDGKSQLGMSVTGGDFYENQ